MRKFLMCAMLGSLALFGQAADARKSASSLGLRTESVSGYYRKNGTYVHGYNRAPSGMSDGAEMGNGSSSGQSSSDPLPGGVTISSATSPAQTTIPSAASTTIYGNPADAPLDAPLDATSDATTNKVSDSTTLAHTGGEPVWMVAFGSLIAFGALALRRRLH